MSFWEVQIAHPTFTKCPFFSSLSLVAQSCLTLSDPMDWSLPGSSIHGIFPEMYKKDVHDPYNHNSVITDLEPDILECEVNWALESITINKASGGDGIPVELFQILKDDAVKVPHSIYQQIWKTQQWPQDWKASVFIPIPKKGNVRECSNYHTIGLISHARKVMVKILQARVQQYVNHGIPDVQAYL